MCNSASIAEQVHQYVSALCPMMDVSASTGVSGTVTHRDCKHATVLGGFRCEIIAHLFED